MAKEMSRIIGRGYGAAWNGERVILSLGWGTETEIRQDGWAANRDTAERFTHCLAQYGTVCRRARVLLRGECLIGGLPFVSTNLRPLADRADHL